MKILKVGRVEPIKAMRFECKECGCEFLAEYNEYNKEHRPYRVIYSVKCPCCESPVIISVRDGVKE